MNNLQVVFADHAPELYRRGGELGTAAVSFSAVDSRRCDVWALGYYDFCNAIKLNCILQPRYA